jgi:hypothetical protein
MNWLSFLLAVSLVFPPVAWAGSKVELTDPDSGIQAAISELGTTGALATQVLNSSGSQVSDFGGTTTGITVNGQKTVASAGTAEVLGSSTTTTSIAIKALHGNGGMVYVGDSGVDSSNGFVLDAGDGIVMEVDNLADIYIDVDTNGEGVSYLAIN